MTQYTEAMRLIQKGRRAETRGKAAKGCMTALVTAVLLNLLRGWLLMLAVGIIHAEWLHDLPTLGYWWAVVISGLLVSAFSAPHQAKTPAAKS